MTVPMEPSTARAAAWVDCGQCAALRGEECVYTSGPAGPVRGYHAGRLALAGHPVSGLPLAAIVWDSGDAPRLPDEDVGTGEIDAMAAALLSGKIIALREYVGRALGDERQDRAEVLGCVAAELAGVSVILAAGTEGVDDDAAEPYCLTCGQWVHMFHGIEGWRHFRGEGTAASPVELYDAGHEPMVGWTVPAGRSLSPADIGLIRQALADTSAWRAWRAEGAGCEACARRDSGRCLDHARHDEISAGYDGCCSASRSHGEPGGIAGHGLLAVSAVGSATLDDSHHAAGHLAVQAVVGTGEVAPPGHGRDRSVTALRAPRALQPAQRARPWTRVLLARAAIYRGRRGCSRVPSGGFALGGCRPPSESSGCLRHRET